MVNIIGTIAVDLVVGMTGQFFSVGTTIELFVRIEREVGNREEPGLGVWTLLETSCSAQRDFVS